MQQPQSSLTMFIYWDKKIKDFSIQGLSLPNVLRDSMRHSLRQRVKINYCYNKDFSLLMTGGMRLYKDGGRRMEDQMCK